MPEIVSKQAAIVAAGNKNLAPAMGVGKKTVFVITSPNTAAYANGDTLANPTKIPKGSRILTDGMVSNAAMGASVVLDVGLRKASDGTAIDQDGIAAGVSVASAGQVALNNGALVAAGVEYITTEDSFLYATLRGATPTANAQIRIEVSVMLPS